MSSHFLDEFDKALIEQDFEFLLLSSEAVVVSAIINRPVGGRTDEAFGVTDYASVSELIVTGNAIQAIVKPIDRDILSWGILEAGDSLFYMSNDFVMGLEDGDSVYFHTPDGMDWSIVPFHMDQFYKFIRTRLGSSQIGQAIPATVKKS